MPFDSQTFLKTLTTKPGVYCMQDAEAKIIYVGKAKNLKNRVSSYFNKSAGHSRKTAIMVSQVENIEITITNTENEALILENNLIKEHKPKYNILFRDDKSYPFIFLSSEHDYPRFSYHRGARKRKGKYFGPYPSAGAVKQTINLIQKLFMIRSCEDSMFANRTRPCLQHQIKRCTAPCTNLISEEDYKKDVQAAMLFLEGKNEAVIESLNQPMLEASDNLQFEKAAKYRDQIQAIRTVQEQQYITGESGNIDIVTCATKNNQSCIQIMFIRNGMQLGKQQFYQANKEDLGEAEILFRFLSQYYLDSHQKRVIPNEILISHEHEDTVLLESILSEQAERKTQIKHSLRRDRAQWMKMAIENMYISFQQHLSSKQSHKIRLEALQALLKFEDNIERIECFDISHTQGEATTASCVVFGEDGPLNNEYRQFTIKDITAGDDFAAMRQAIHRRYTRVVKEDAKLPDLILIDGGKGQLSSAREILSELQLNDIPTIGVAKGPSRKAGLETLILEDGKDSWQLDHDSPALHLIQFVRDESHRFAITKHRQKRAKNRNTSSLEGIPGIGSKRRQALLKHFGGLAGIKRAGVEDIRRVPGISKQLAETIYDIFHA